MAGKQSYVKLAVKDKFVSIQLAERQASRAAKTINSLSRSST